MTAGVSLTIHGVDGNGFSLVGQSGNDWIYAGIGDQTLYGNSGDDVLYGNIGNQMLYGGSGNDYIWAGWGNQTLDGGSGSDVVDFSRLAGVLVYDQDLHKATISDTTTGAVVYTYSVTSFDSVIGTDYGSTIYGQHNSANTYTFGGGANVYHGESGGDTVTTLNGGATTFGWMKKYVSSGGHIDTITDFHIGVDRLDMSDFLKGQLVKPTGYADVVHVLDYVDANGQHGAMIQTQAAGVWYATAMLTGVDVNNVGADHHALKLSDLGVG